jgi:predicted nucleotide-binding protein
MRERNAKHVIQTEAISRKLEERGFICTAVRQLAHGVQLRFSTGAIVNVYTTGKITVQGKNTAAIEQALEVKPAE